MMKNSKNTFAKFQLMGLAILPLIPLIFKPDLLDDKPSMCVSIILFDMECYGCGMGRALLHLIHFEIVDAYYFNPLSFLVFPILIFLWAKNVIKLWKTISKKYYQKT